MMTIRSIRDRLGLTQAQLKDTLNFRLGRKYDRHTVSRWENGHSPIPKDIQEELAILLSTNQKRTNILAFANQKGGVGKTTSALNIAGALARLGRKVLFVDADPQASATLALLGRDMVAAHRLNKTLPNVILKDRPIEESLFHQGENPDLQKSLPFALLASHIDLAEVEIRREPGTEGLLKSALEAVQNEYEFIIIDSPPNLGYLTWMALSASHTVFIPVRTEPYDVMGVNLILETITKVKRRSNPRLRLGGILPTQFSKREYVDHEVIQHLIKVMKDLDPSFLSPELLGDDHTMGGKSPILEPVGTSTAFSNAAWEGTLPINTTSRSQAVQVYLKMARALSEGSRFNLAEDVLSLED